MLKRMFKGGITAAAVLAMGIVPALAQKTTVTVYTALENDQVAPYKAAFEAENPNIEISWVRDSTGVITARFLAEKDNPKADVIWGLAATSLLLFKKQGLLEAYTPAGFAALKPAYKDAEGTPAWTGMDAWLAVVCYNTAEGAKDEGDGARELGGPDQARVQGPDRDAASGVFRHRLSGDRGLAADHGRGKGLGVHGQAP